MANELPDLGPAALEPLPVETLTKVTADARATAPPAPEPSKKKPSGASRRGDMTTADYKKTKKELAGELAQLRTQLTANAGATATGATPAPGAGVVLNGPDPITRREQFAKQLAALVSCLLVIAFEVMAELRKAPTWKISEQRGEQLGELWAEALVDRISVDVNPADVALLAAAGSTLGLVVTKFRQEKTAKSSPAPMLAADAAAPAAAPSPPESPLTSSIFGPSR